MFAGEGQIPLPPIRLLTSNFARRQIAPGTIDTAPHSTQAHFSSATNQAGDLFRASARTSWVACHVSKPAAGGGAKHHPPSSLLPYRFSGRHFLELMVDFATDRTKKLVEFVSDWRPVGRALILELIHPHLSVHDLLLELPNQRENFFLLFGSESIRRLLHSFQLRLPGRHLCQHRLAIVFYFHVNPFLFDLVSTLLNIWYAKQAQLLI